ncbi:MAG: hypothetical protein OXC40_07490 [Proteobacteria bacterium]|nr:hypothetical protein [Pseudomonadota bacterium]
MTILNLLVLLTPLLVMGCKNYQPTQALKQSSSENQTARKKPACPEGHVQIPIGKCIDLQEKITDDVVKKTAKQQEEKKDSDQDEEGEQGDHDSHNNEYQVSQETSITFDGDEFLLHDPLFAAFATLTYPLPVTMIVTGKKDQKKKSVKKKFQTYLSYQENYPRAYLGLHYFDKESRGFEPQPEHPFFDHLASLMTTGHTKVAVTIVYRPSDGDVIKQGLDHQSVRALIYSYMQHISDEILVNQLLSVFASSSDQDTVKITQDFKDLLRKISNY